jgi:hypothetical protein
VKGTPFDKSNQRHFRQTLGWDAKGQKAVRDCVLSPRTAGSLAHAVSPGNEQNLHTPVAPKPVAVAKKAEVTGKETTAAAVPPAPGKTLTAEGNSRAHVRQSETTIQHWSQRRPLR